MKIRQYSVALALWLLGSLMSISVASSIDVYEFDTPEQEAQFQTLIGELRCPKCQNQAIGDSNAPIAQDMRAKVHDLLLDGLSEGEVVDYLVERYGDFVYYKPPVNAATLILWLGPLGAMLIGGWSLYRRARLPGSGSANAGAVAEEGEADDYVEPTQHQAYRVSLRSKSVLYGLLFVLMFSGAFYYQTSDWRKVRDWNHTAGRLAELSELAMSGHNMTRAQLQDLALALRTSLSQQEDASGWSFLGRVAVVLGDQDMAEQSWRRALALEPGNMNHEIDLIQSLMDSRHETDRAEAVRRLEGILAREPQDPVPYLLAGFVARQQGMWMQTKAYWEKGLSYAVPGSEQASMLENGLRSLNEAISREMGSAHGEAGISEQAAQGDAADADSAAAAASEPAVVTGFEVVLDISAELRARLPEQGTLMLFARPEGSRMPVAAKRMRLMSLPATISLSDGDVMMEGSTMVDSGPLEIVARISTDQDVIGAENGDLQGLSQQATALASGEIKTVRVIIDQQL